MAYFIITWNLYIEVAQEKLNSVITSFFIQDGPLQILPRYKSLTSDHFKEMEGIFDWRYIKVSKEL